MAEEGKLGFWEIFSIGVGGMVGGGIFATLGLSLELSRGAAPLAFLFAGLIALLTSYSYAKLSSRYPSMGGTIEFLVRAYGDNIWVGGLNIMLLSSYIVMIALYAHAFASYGASLIPAYYRVTYIILAIIAIGSLTIVNLLGAVISGRVELGLVAFKTTVLVSVAIIGMKMVQWQRLHPYHWPPLPDVVAGGMIIFLAYEGFELISNTGGDAENTTILRRALYASVVTVITIYILVAIVAAGALTPEIVEKARDYALAILVKPILGKTGEIIVIAAALASTSSAINATLYGTARMSYLVAKYGEIPEIFEKRIWRNSYEGLIIIATLSLILTLGASLESISTAGSGGFLIIFTIINTAAYKLHNETGANKTLTILGALLSLAALTIMIWRMTNINPTALTILTTILIGSITTEYAYRKTTKRKIKKPIDPTLKQREKLLKQWKQLATKIDQIIKTTIKDAETYIIGSHAKNQPQKAGDIDILIITSKKLTKKQKQKIQQQIQKQLNLPPNHPIHLHTTTPQNKQKYKQKIKTISHHRS